MQSKISLKVDVDSSPIFISNNCAISGSLRNPSINSLRSIVPPPSLSIRSKTIRNHSVGTIFVGASPARARFFFCWFFFLGGLWEGLVLKTAAGKPSCSPAAGQRSARGCGCCSCHHVRHQHAPVGQKREPGRVIELRLRRSAVMVPPLLAVARHRAPAGGPGTAVRVTLRP